MRLRDTESIIAEVRPAPLLRLVWLFTRAPVPALYFVVAFACIWSVVSIRPRVGGVLNIDPEFFLLGSFIAFLVAWMASYVYYSFLAKTLHYTITNRRLVFSGGLVRRVEHSVPVSKVSDVQTSRNLLEQLLGLVTVNLFTPGTATVRTYGRTQPIAELRFEGIPFGSGVADEIFRLVEDNGKEP